MPPEDELSSSPRDDAAGAPRRGVFVCADAPPPPRAAAPWRGRLYVTLHTRRAHIIHLVVIVADVCMNLSGLLLALFTCRTPHHARAAAARTAEEALRYTSVALLSLLLGELFARVVAVGPLRFFRSPAHALDAAVLAGLLAVEASVSDAAASEAIGLLVIVRVARMIRLLATMQEYAADARQVASARRVKALEARVRELEAELRQLRAENGCSAGGGGGGSEAVAAAVPAVLS
jgi:hypothetical protein